MAVPGCVFCRIIQGDEPASMVYSGEGLAAFMDIQPVNEGHILVVPRAHASRLAELDPPTAGRMFQMGRELAGALRASGIRCEGVNLFLADGAAAGQEVDHVHLHVIPRYRQDGFGFRFGPLNRNLPGRSELDQTAAAIRRALEDCR